MLMTFNFGAIAFGATTVYTPDISEAKHARDAM